MKYKVKSWIIAIILVAASTVAPASAETAPDRSLGISPLRNELTIAPGTSFDGTLSLTNSGKTPLVVTLDAEAFSVTNEVYDYSFNPSGNGVEWVSFSNNSVTIPPSGLATVTYKVAVPISAEPGGRYISLFASSSPTASSTGVTSINRVASLLYITIAGDVTRTGKVLTFNSPIITFGNPAWSATIQNSGTAHFHSLYSVTVKSLFGGNALKTVQGDSLILPSSVRLISQSIPNPDWIGVYRLDYTIGLGDIPAKQETRWILYLPPFQTLVCTVGIVFAGLLLIPRRKKKIESPRQPRNN